MDFSQVLRHGLLPCSNDAQTATLKVWDFQKKSAIAMFGVLPDILKMHMIMMYTMHAFSQFMAGQLPLLAGGPGSHVAAATGRVTWSNVCKSADQAIQRKCSSCTFAVRVRTTGTLAMRAVYREWDGAGWFRVGWGGWCSDGLQCGGSLVNLAGDYFTH